MLQAYSMSQASAIINYLRSQHTPQIILLGGSRATEAASKHSDWDLFCIGDYTKRGGAAARINDASLDIALVPLSQIKEQNYVLRNGYAPCAGMLVLLDDADQLGAKIVSTSYKAYESGPAPISGEHREKLRLGLLRRVDRVATYQANPELRVEPIIAFVEKALEVYYDYRTRWSIPLKKALPQLEQESPELRSLLGKLLLWPADGATGELMLLVRQVAGLVLH